MGRSRPVPDHSQSRGASATMLLVGVLLVAANLRAVMTAVGPVLPVMGEDRGMSPTELGVLVAIPILAFAVVSPLVHSMAGRHGVERTVFFALLVLAIGTVVRSLPSGIALWVGTAIIGAAIAVGNVLLPVVVRHDFPDRIPVVTGYYIASQSVVAGAASGLAVPLAALAGSWELAIGVWVLLIVAGVISWLPRMKQHGAEASDAPLPDIPASSPTVWTSGLAWQVAAYFGLQSTVFYVLVNWLPTVEQDLGVPPATAGWHLSMFLAAGIVANLAAPWLMRLGGDQRTAAASTAALTIVAASGLIMVPELVALWVALGGVAVGASMVVALSLISLRSGDATAGSRLSSMAQSIGYLGVACGLVVAGGIREVTGPGTHLLVYVTAVAALQLLVGLRVGRNRLLTPRAGQRS